MILSCFSAGVGRSGSYILIDSMRRHLLHCDSLNIFAHLKHIRKQRQRLVQTLVEFSFCSLPILIFRTNLSSVTKWLRSSYDME